MSTSTIILNNICANFTDKLELTNSFITSEKELKKLIKINTKYDIEKTARIISNFIETLND